MRICRLSLLNRVVILASRCPFCERVLFVAPSGRETFRAVILAHLLKCELAPPLLTFAEAAAIADNMISDAAEE